MKKPLVAREENLLEKTFENIKQVLFYFSKELTVEKGEYLEILNNDKKWWRCRNSKDKVTKKLKQNIQMIFLYWSTSFQGGWLRPLPTPLSYYLFGRIFFIVVLYVPHTRQLKNLVKCRCELNLWMFSILFVVYITYTLVNAASKSSHILYSLADFLCEVGYIPYTLLTTLVKAEQAWEAEQRKKKERSFR